MDDETEEWQVDWVLFSFEPCQQTHNDNKNVINQQIKTQQSLSRLGMCPSCKKYIGRGLFLHQKYCEA